MTEITKENAIVILQDGLTSLFNYMRTDDFGNTSVEAKTYIEETKRSLIRSMNILRRLNNEN